MDSRAFDYKRIAEGYAKDRPYLHGRVMERFLKSVGFKKTFENGLDVGCGAGLSSRALRAICGHVTGADISEEMVRAAEAACGGDGFRFLQSSAEQLTAPDDTYDIVTAAGVINWVEEKVFLGRLAAIMKDEGILLIYDFGITDRMKDHPAYTRWYQTEYLKRFPKPPRKEREWTEADAAPFGFELVSRDSWSEQYDMDEDSFIRFMLLQSNVNVCVEEQGESPEEVKKWFEATLHPVLGGLKRTYIFDGYSWIFKLHKTPVMS